MEIPPVIEPKKTPKRMAVRIVLLSVSLIVGTALLVAFTGAGCSSKSQVASLLAEAKLSPLPPSATNIAYYQWNGLFTGETYAKFELSPSDLRVFVSNSPSLHGVKPKEVYSTNYQHVLYPPGGSDVTLNDVEHYDHFSQHPKFPAWYDLTIHGNGKKYVIDWGPNMMILIDEDRHIVWLRVVKG